MNGRRALLRHTLATVAYSGGKAVRGAPGEVDLIQDIVRLVRVS